MKRKASILYAWFIRSILFFFPDVPILMQLRGYLYSFAMRRCGKNFQVAHSAILNSISNLESGDNVYIANGATLLCGGCIELSDNILIGPGVIISSDNHQFSNIDGYRTSPVKFAKVVIGEGSWLCANSVVTAGSNFPPFSILTPASVFTKNINYGYDLQGIFAGNPAYRTKEHKPKKDYENQHSNTMF